MPNDNKKLIALDRDGVINVNNHGFYITSPDDWTPLPRSLEAIALLNKLGYNVAVCTNQSGIKKGMYSVWDLEQIHRKMRQLLASLGGLISAVYFCPHDDNDNCNCRKPKPQMLLNACRDFAVTNQQELMFVGDSECDLQAIASIGGKPILVRTGNGASTLKSVKKLPEGTLIFDDLFAVSQYLERCSKS